MAEPLKEMFNRQAVDWLAARLAAAAPGFPRAKFVRAIVADLPALELIARVDRIAGEMRRHLPDDFRQAVKIVAAALGEPSPPGDGTDFGSFRVLPCHRFVALAGLDHPDHALAYFRDATRHFSGEFDVRPFIQRDQAKVLRVMRDWADDKDWRVRRLASEGSRPRLPWGLRLQGLVQDPAPIFPILEALRDDSIEAVRRSVANSVNDIAKDHPDRAVALIAAWQGAASRAPLIRHALRHLVKQGHDGALQLMGVDRKARFAVADLALDRGRVRIGQSLGLSLTLRNAGRTTARAILDYAVHHLGARGELRPKVFKWREVELAPGDSIRLERRHSLKPVTTRRYYPGAHKLDIRVNGRILAEAAFHLGK
ncbi:3-methyladenine DNA glycosylase AlkC [Dongia mobilis]|uniref:3-methyladenine DNA glycosylase AlkC n=1 Tax=Dongia mobilis TaxID=578943 RepID=A0A4R6WT49_9PROT|nr:DNA alkylation repair protein [Dongia mobilis]TDQ86399.1 3-methyladenine DNA glycosylase AlkC [Dongia mobilis]